MSSDAPADRYEGRPLVRLLELYVLWAIGELSLDQERQARAITPKLASALGTSGEWFEIIASAMNFERRMPNLIRESWAKNSQIARDEGETLTAQRFAELFVDANYTE